MNSLKKKDVRLREVNLFFLCLFPTWLLLQSFRKDGVILFRPLSDSIFQEVVFSPELIGTVSWSAKTRSSHYLRNKSIKILTNFFASRSCGVMRNWWEPVVSSYLVDRQNYSNLQNPAKSTCKTASFAVLSLFIFREHARIFIKSTQHFQLIFINQSLIWICEWFIFIMMIRPQVNSIHELSMRIPEYTLWDVSCQNSRIQDRQPFFMI